mmetsp:Transcript_12345/g.20450  ORF Transcript_12345/g.20450 Transcript_12345/m.20450 type:complete len:145 (+) Transcript_12345:169-603(+)
MQPPSPPGMATLNTRDSTIYRTIGRITSSLNRRTTASLEPSSKTTSVTKQSLTMGVSVISKNPIVEENITSGVEQQKTFPEQIADIELNIRLLEEERAHLLDSKRAEEQHSTNASKENASARRQSEGLLGSVTSGTNIDSKNVQ